MSEEKNIDTILTTLIRVESFQLLNGINLTIEMWKVERGKSNNLITLNSTG